MVDANGKANINIQDKCLAFSGKRSIIGRAVVVHELRDDLGKGGNAGSLKNGNAGSRIACGVIGIA